MFAQHFSISVNKAKKSLITHEAAQTFSSVIQFCQQLYNIFPWLYGCMDVDLAQFSNPRSPV